MSDILDMAHDMAKDLHEVGAMDDITMRVMDRICVPEKPSFTPARIKKIRAKSRMSQLVFAQFLHVGATTVAQWEQGRNPRAVLRRGCSTSSIGKASRPSSELVSENRPPL